MATAPPRPQTWDRAAAHRRAVHPLRSLRGYIRLYVGLEGLLVTALYLAVWFWLGLLLDYGLFKLTGVDWVQALPHTFRVVVLVLLTFVPALSNWLPHVMGFK